MTERHSLRLDEIQEDVFLRPPLVHQLHLVLVLLGLGVNCDQLFKPESGSQMILYVVTLLGCLRLHEPKRRRNRCDVLLNVAHPLLPVFVPIDDRYDVDIA